jgi:hypothetical protein
VELQPVALATKPLTENGLLISADTPNQNDQLLSLLENFGWQ